MAHDWYVKLHAAAWSAARNAVPDELEAHRDEYEMYAPGWQVVARLQRRLLDGPPPVVAQVSDRCTDTCFERLPYRPAESRLVVLPPPRPE